MTYINYLQKYSVSKANPFIAEDSSCMRKKQQVAADGDSTSDSSESCTTLEMWILQQHYSKVVYSFKNCVLRGVGTLESIMVGQRQFVEGLEYPLR